MNEVAQMPSMMTPVPEIIRLAGAVFGVRSSAIYGPAKPQPIARARQAVYLVANEQGWSMSHIGRVIARDPRTISYGIGNAREIAKRDPTYAERCDALRGFVELYKPATPTCATQFVAEMGAQAV